MTISYNNLGSNGRVLQQIVDLIGQFLHQIATETQTTDCLTALQWSL
jgi:hypothetical protein